MNLSVLREIVGLDSGVERQLDADGLLIERQDGTKWIDNDHPFDEYVAVEIGKSSGRFAVADEYGGIVGGPYRSLMKAEEARSGAKVTIATEVEVDEDADEAQ